MHGSRNGEHGLTQLSNGLELIVVHFLKFGDGPLTEPPGIV